MSIILNNLQFQWPGSGFSLNVPALTVDAGERLFLLGASGSGKSTLLNLLAGILVPDQGRISLLGTDVSTLSARRRDRFRARHIGLIFQQFNLIPYLDVETNVRLATHFGKCPANGSRANICVLLDSLGLATSVLARRADSLSVGQQQRVAIARAVINRPEIIIADEPTSALDSAARDSFMQLLLSAGAEQEATIIFVSHDKALAGHFTRVLDIAALNNGRASDAA